MDAGAIWSLAGPFGTERWSGADGRFTLLSLRDRPLPSPSDALTLTQLRARASGCVHPGPFPSAFRHCPACGTALGAMPPWPAPECWSPPFGAADGLPSLDEHRVPDADSHEEIPLPDAAPLAFAVAGTPAMLLCIDRGSGWIAGWSEERRTWGRRCRTAPGAGLPAWSWAAGADASGLAVPTDGGPGWIDLSCSVLPEAKTETGVFPLGGVALLSGWMAMPVKAAGVLVIAISDAAGRWSTLPVADAPQTLGTPFAAPVVTGQVAHWCGQDGHLTLDAASDGFISGWQPWRDGLRPLPGVRPVLERNGTAHQLARLDTHTLVLESLPLPGRPAERRIARGYTPGTGRAVFRETMRLRLPWDEREAADYNLPDGDFMWPLLALAEDRYLVATCSGRGGLGAFLGDPASLPGNGPHVCTLHFSRGPRALDPLGCVLRARHAWGLAAFVHAGWLYVHGALDNRCHRWRLSDAP